MLQREFNYQLMQLRNTGDHHRALRVLFLLISHFILLIISIFSRLLQILHNLNHILINLSGVIHN